MFLGITVQQWEIFHLSTALKWISLPEIEVCQSLKSDLLRAYVFEVKPNTKRTESFATLSEKILPISWATLLQNFEIKRPSQKHWMYVPTLHLHLMQKGDIWLSILLGIDGVMWDLWSVLYWVSLIRLQISVDLASCQSSSISCPTWSCSHFCITLLISDGSSRTANKNENENVLCSFSPVKIHVFF